MSLPTQLAAAGFEAGSIAAFATSANKNPLHVENDEA
jgi:hypothetical protein